MIKKFILVFALMIVTAATAYAADTRMTVSISERITSEQDEYYVTADISGNTGFISAQLELFYDADDTECLQIIPGEVISDMMTDYNPKTVGERTSAVISAAGTENTNADGNIVTFVFKKLNDADPGFDFSVSELRAKDGQTVECETVINNSLAAAEPSPEIGKPQPTDTPQPSVTPKPDNSSSGGMSSRPSGNKTQPPSSTPTPEPTAAPVGEPPEETPAASVKFTDVPETHWASGFIREAAALGIVSGYTDGTFLPDNEMTRAEFAALLWNMNGRPDARSGTPFTDVTEDKWFYKQVKWCYNKGYIKGITDTEFLPDGKITREQAMTILYRVLGSPETGAAVGRFEDAADISDFALPAMNWAVENEIISGVSETRVEPKANATRAQLAAIIIKFMKTINQA